MIEVDDCRECDCGIYESAMRFLNDYTQEEVAKWQFEKYLGEKIEYLVDY